MKELARFSATKALAEISNQREPGIEGEVTGLERECSDALKEQVKRRNGIVPDGDRRITVQRDGDGRLSGAVVTEA